MYKEKCIAVNAFKTVTRFFAAQLTSVYKTIVYIRQTKRQTSGTSSEHEWQRVIKRVTMNDNKWYNEWQRVAQRMTSDNEWQQVTASGHFG